MVSTIARLALLVAVLALARAALRSGQSIVGAFADAVTHGNAAR